MPANQAGEKPLSVQKYGTSPTRYRASCHMWQTSLDSRAQTRKKEKVCQAILIDPDCNTISKGGAVGGALPCRVGTSSNY